MKRIVITLEGGLVQNVLTEEPTEIVVIDYDTDDAEEDEISVIFNGKAVMRQFNSEVNIDDVNTAFAPVSQ